MSDLDYYKGLEDYDDIKPYLNTEPVENSVPNDIFPSFVPDFSTAILVENVPVCTKDKLPKLLALLVKIYSQICPTLNENSIHMPMDDSMQSTLGFCFVMFNSKEEAEQAVKSTQGFAIDKKHSFKVCLYSELDRYENIPEEFVAPPPPPFNPRPDPTSWLTDSQCRDQFVIRHSHETEVFWSNVTGEEPAKIYGGEREKVDGKVWCENIVCWSPQGTYLVTFHGPGIRLWGSSDFQPFGRFAHAKVEDVSFSPCENYLITYRFTYNAQLNPAEAIIVWDIRTGAKIRNFEMKSPLEAKFMVQATITEDREERKDGQKIVKKIDRIVRGRVKSYEEDRTGGRFVIEEGKETHTVEEKKVTPLQDPNRLKWSPDGKYVARLAVDMISVYALPGMQLLDKKSIAAKDILDFVWSPKSNMISYWSPAAGNHPALINIISIPDRVDICSRKLFDVSDGRMVWQNEGDYLCVHMTKMQGKKKSYVLMFFRVRDTGVPVEQLELNEPILHVSWEPSGDRLVIMSGETKSPTIAFYSMSGSPANAATPAKGSAAGATNAAKGAQGSGNKTAANRNELVHLFTKTGQQCNDIFWSPAGGVVALAYFAPDSCIFELYDVENNLSFATRRHDRCSRLYWDPSGRFIASCTISDMRGTVKSHVEDGVNFYNFQGNLLCSMRKEKLFQFIWRPRPKDLLSAEERKKIVKNLRKYEKMFEKEDKQRKAELNQEIVAARHRQAEEFLAKLKRNRSLSALLKPQRVALRDGYDSDDDRNYQIEVLCDETVLSSKDHLVH